MHRIFRIILIIVGISLLVFLLWYFQSLVAYILIAAVLSLIGNPLVTLIRRIRIKNFRPSRALAAGLTLLLIWTFIFLFFSIFIPVVAKEINYFSKIDVQAVINSLQEPLTRIEKFFNKMSPASEEPFSFQNYAGEKIFSFFEWSLLTNFLKSFASVLGDIFIAIFSISFILFFLLKEEGLLGRAILSLIPKNYKDEVSHILSSVNHLLKRYFIGIIIEVMSVAFLITIGLTIIGVKINHALIIASFAAIMNVIPYIGPIIGAVFGIFMGIVTHINLDFYTELLPLITLMAAVFISVQIADNVLFQPLIYSSSVNAHPLEIFLVIMMAGNLAGILGMVLAIPSYTILRVIAKEFFNNIEVVKKLTRNI